MSQRQHVSKACEFENKSTPQRVTLQSCLLTTTTHLLSLLFQVVCVAPSSFLVDEGDPEAYHRNSYKSFIEKKKEKIMAGARGCFNCGGCAWCFRVVVVVVSPSRASCTDAACTYLSTTHPPFSPSLLFPFLFYCRAWSGADGDRVFFHTLHTYRPGPIKKNSLSKNIAWSVCIVTLPVLSSRPLSDGHQAANCPKAGTPTW
jgi:hypothetical protein